MNYELLFFVRKLRYTYVCIIYYIYDNALLMVSDHIFESGFDSWFRPTDNLMGILDSYDNFCRHVYRHLMCVCNLYHRFDKNNLQ